MRLQPGVFVVSAAPQVSLVDAGLERDLAAFELAGFVFLARARLVCSEFKRFVRLGAPCSRTARAQRLPHTG